VVDTIDLGTGGIVALGSYSPFDERKYDEIR
jgi:hypothetical protein